MNSTNSDSMPISQCHKGPWQRDPLPTSNLRNWTRRSKKTIFGFNTYQVSDITSTSTYLHLQGVLHLHLHPIFWKAKCGKRCCNNKLKLCTVQNSSRQCIGSHFGTLFFFHVSGLHMCWQCQNLAKQQHPFQCFARDPPRTLRTVHTPHHRNMCMAQLVHINEPSSSSTMSNDW